MGSKEDFEFLRDVGSMEMKSVAQKWAGKMGWEAEKSEMNCRAWLHRIRVRIERYQNYLNKIYGMQRSNARIRKFTISGALPAPKEDEAEKY
jgi:hypothetical protein